MTPPLAVPMDSLDQIHPEHMTLSAELPDFTGDHEAQSQPRRPPSPIITGEEPQVAEKQVQDPPQVAPLHASPRQPEAEVPRPMMAQASTSGSVEFNMQAWTEGLNQHMEQVQEAYKHQVQQKKLVELDVAALRAELSKARAEREESIRIME